MTTALFVSVPGTHCIARIRFAVLKPIDRRLPAPALVWDRTTMARGEREKAKKKKNVVWLRRHSIRDDEYIHVPASSGSQLSVVTAGQTLVSREKVGTDAESSCSW